MSSGKITRFQNNVRIDGYLDLSRSTAGYITIPSLSSAPSNPAVGMQYYDTTLGLIRMYQASGWSNINGTAAGSLDAAYNGGATVTVDGGAVTLNDSQTNTAGGLLITKSGAVTGADSASVFHINSTGAHDTSGALKMLEISVGAETVSGGVYGIEIAMNANDDLGLMVTKGAVTLTDGALLLSSGNFTMSSGNANITGTLTVSGTSTLAAINNSGAITSQGALVLDLDSANAFVLRRNGTGTSLINVDSTSDAGDTQFTFVSETTTGIGTLMTLATTTGTGLSIDASTVTTGDALKIKVVSGTMTAAGSAISVIDGATEVFAVRDDGSIYSKATAEGTTALQLVTGDLVVTDGDLTLSGGEVSITDGVTTTGSGLLLTSTVTTSAGAFKVVGNALTSGTLALLSTSGTVTGVVLDISAAALTTGKVLDISDLDAITTGKAIHVDATGVTHSTGILVHLDSAGTAITGAGRLLRVDHTGATTTSGVLTEFASAANDETVIVRITDSSLLAGGVALDLSLATMTTGTAIDAGDLNALTTGVGVNLVSNSSDTGAFKLINAKIDHASATGGIVAHFTHDAAAGTAVKIDTISTTGSALHIDNASGVQADNTGLVFIDHGGNMADGSNIIRIAPTGTPVEGSVAIEIVGASKVIQGLVIDTDTATASANTITGGGVRSADTAVLSVIADVAASNADSQVVRINQSSATGANVPLGILQADVSEPFILFESTAGAGNSIDTTATTQGAIAGFIRISVNGADQYITVCAAPSGP